MEGEEHGTDGGHVEDEEHGVDGGHVEDEEHGMEEMGHLTIQVLLSYSTMHYPVVHLPFPYMCLPYVVQYTLCHNPVQHRIQNGILLRNNPNNLEHLDLVNQDNY